MFGISRVKRLRLLRGGGAHTQTVTHPVSDSVQQDLETWIKCEMHKLYVDIILCTDVDFNVCVYLSLYGSCTYRKKSQFLSKVKKYPHSPRVN